MSADQWFVATGSTLTCLETGRKSRIHGNEAMCAFLELLFDEISDHTLIRSTVMDRVYKKDGHTFEKLRDF